MTADFFLTGGKFRSHPLKTPRNSLTHPMGSRERLALFNSLSPFLPGARVLDLYAGTGALGLEALSRGAAHITFVESSAAALKALRSNLDALHLADSVVVHSYSVESFLRTSFARIHYNLILVDPPYPLFLDSKSKTLSTLLSSLPSLSFDLLVLSHPDTFDPASLNFKLLKTKKYAAARLSLFTKS